MMTSTIGDMSRQFMLSRQSARMKESITTLSQEMTTGIVRDKMKHVQGDVAMLASLEQKIASSTLRKTLGDNVSIILSGQQRVLENMRADAERAAHDILSLNNFADAAQIDRSVSSLYAGFEDAIKMLNTNLAGRSIFAGVDAHGPALASASTIMVSLRADLPPDPSPEAFSTFVDAWFSQGGGFDAIGYIGGGKIVGAVDLGNGIEVNPDTTADDQAFRTTLAGFAKGALLSDASLFTAIDHKRAVLASSASTLLQGTLGLVDLSARVGIDEERAATATSRAGAEQTALSIARAELLSADPHESAIKLENVMTQLDLIFSLTSRLSRLKLSDYLR